MTCSVIYNCLKFIFVLNFVWFFGLASYYYLFVFFWLSKYRYWKSEQVTLCLLFRFWKKSDFLNPNKPIWKLRFITKIIIKCQKGNQNRLSINIFIPTQGFENFLENQIMESWSKGDIHSWCLVCMRSCIIILALPASIVCQSYA